MTYNGDRATIKSNRSTLVNESALITANFIMFQKIANVLSILSFVLISTTLGASYFGYKYVTSEQFKTKLMNEVLGNVQGMMPKVLEKGLPDITGESIPIKPTISPTTLQKIGI